jgi:hypothetical protein
MAFILAIEKDFERGWSKLSVESNSKVAIQVTKDHSMVTIARNMIFLI